MPRITQQAKEANRRKIIDSASVMFREHGADQVGIDQLMQAAGLTRGGFYNHFDSKEALVAEACHRAFDDQLRDLNDFLHNIDAADPLHALEHLAQRYLSDHHRKNPAVGCPAPSLGVDSARHTALTQRQYADGVEEYLRTFTELLSSGLPLANEPPSSDGPNETRDDSEIDARCSLAPQQLRARAVETFILLVGGMVVARAVDEADPELSDEFLNGARDMIAGIIARPVSQSPRNTLDRVPP
jgi:TetR/AcrR family transcriptional repressor of nem operon